MWYVRDFEKFFEKSIHVRSITVKRAQNGIKARANGLIIGEQILILGEGFGKISEGGLQFVSIVCIFGGVSREKITIQAGCLVIADGDGITFERTGGAIRIIGDAGKDEFNPAQAIIRAVIVDAPDWEESGYAVVD